MLDRVNHYLNAQGIRDPEMHQTKKGKQCFLGLVGAPEARRRVRHSHQHGSPLRRRSTRCGLHQSVAQITQLRFLAIALLVRQQGFVRTARELNMTPHVAKNHTRARLCHQLGPPMADRERLWMAKISWPSAAGQTARTGEGRLAVRLQLRRP